MIENEIDPDFFNLQTALEIARISKYKEFKYGNTIYVEFDGKYRILEEKQK